MNVHRFKIQVFAADNRDTMIIKVRSHKPSKPPKASREANRFIGRFLLDFTYPKFGSQITSFKTPELRSCMRKTMRSGSHSLETDDLLVVSKHLFADPTMRTVKYYKKVDGCWVKLKRKEWSRKGRMHDLLIDLIDGYQLNVQ